MDDEFISDKEVEAYERRNDPARRSVRWSFAAVAAVFLFVLGAYALGRSTGGQETLLASLFGGASEESGETFPLRGAGEGTPGTAAVPERPMGNGTGKGCGFESGGKVEKSFVVISEIAWMGTEEGAQYEWIELANVGNAPANTGGWTIVDKDEQIQVVFPKSTVILPNGFLLLTRSAGTVGNARADIRYTGNLKNENEALRLFDTDCEIVDEVSASPKWPAGESGEKRTMERDLTVRLPDHTVGGWYTSSNIGGTPRARNSPTPPSLSLSQNISTSTDTERYNILYYPPTSTVPTSTVVTEPAPPPTAHGMVVISEVMAGKDGATNWDFVELHNPGPTPVLLTGWSVKKKSSTGNESALVASSRLEGMVILAGGYILLAHPDYMGTSDVVWPKSYTLAYTSNAVVLYDTTGTRIDEISWAEIPKGQSYAEVNGTWTLKAPTPGSP